MAAFITPFSSMNFLMLNEGISLECWLSHMYWTYKTLHYWGLTHHEQVCLCGWSLSCLLPSSDDCENSFIPFTIVQFLPGIDGLWLSSHICHEFIPKFHEGRDSLMQELCNSSKIEVSPWYSIRILSNVLLLALPNVYNEIELFPTWPTCVCFLPTICSLLFSQVQNVSQNWDAHLTKLDLLGGQTCPAWESLICDTPTDLLCSERCLLILNSIQYLKTKKWQWSARWLCWRKGASSQFYIWHM